MSSDGVYLRSRTKIEPLVCGWYAWTHLVSPVQHAMNVTFRHIPLLKSFIRNPQVHTAAARDPALFGGPFIGLPAERVPEVQELLRDTQKRCARLIALADDLKKLDLRLQETAHGYSLHEVYLRAPDALSGLVEFLYDLNNQPRLRLFEDLVYDENLCAEAYEVMLTTTSELERHFFMSTPRLPGPDNAIFRMHFAHESLDMLAAARTQPVSFAKIAEALNVPPGETPRLSQFFTPKSPVRHAPDYRGEGVRVRYFGHACVLIQTNRTSILIDPMVAWEDDKEDGRLTFNDLPDRIDYVVLSHNHQDHCSPEMLIQLRHRLGRVLVPANNSGSLADPSMRLMLRHLGIRDVHVLFPFEELPVGDGRIVSLPFPGEHVDLDIHARHGIHVEMKGRRLAFLVDSDGWDAILFQKIALRIGRRLDALFVGMECHGAPLTWLYGPLLTKAISRRDDESRRLSGLDSERAWKVLQQFEAARVFVYAMGQEPWLRYIMGVQYTPDSIQLKEVAAFLERCAQARIPAESLYISKEMEL